MHHSAANTQSYVNSWAPCQIKLQSLQSIRLSTSTEDWPSSLLNKTYRNSQLSTNITAPSHDSSLPTIGRDNHPIKPTPICESALLEQDTSTTFQTLMGIEDHCHMEHQGHGLPQCSQQRLAKRTCQRNP